MTAYILRRLALMIPTLLGIMLISFIIIQFAPGGPIERIIAQLNGTNVDATSRIGGSTSGDFSRVAQPGANSGVNSRYRAPAVSTLSLSRASKSSSVSISRRPSAFS